MSGKWGYGTRWISGNSWSYCNCTDVWLTSDGGGWRNRSECLGAGQCYRASVSRAASDGGGHCRRACIRFTGKCNRWWNRC